MVNTSKVVGFWGLGFRVKGFGCMTLSTQHDRNYDILVSLWSPLKRIGIW